MNDSYIQGLVVEFKVGLSTEHFLSDEKIFFGIKANSLTQWEVFSRFYDRVIERQ